MVHHVEIFGQSYSLRADASAEEVSRIAEVVDTRMREVAASSRSVSTLQIAVLAALDIASEFLQTGEACRRLAAEVDSRSNSMARRIDDLSPEVLTDSNGFPCCVRDSAGSC